MHVPGGGGAFGSNHRRPRSAAGGRISNLHHSRDGSFFSLSQTVIEEEDDELITGDARSLPSDREAPASRQKHRRRHRPASANPLGRRYRHGSRERRRGRRRRKGDEGRTGMESRQSGLHGTPVYVHRVNGGQGGVLWGPRPSSATAISRPSPAPLATVGVRSPSAPLPALNGHDARPTYRDWKSKHFGGAIRPRPRPKHSSDTWTRRAAFGTAAPLPTSVPGGERANSMLGATSTSFDLPSGAFEITSAGSGFSVGSTGPLVRSSSPLRWPRPDGGRTQHSDRVESDSLGGFSSRYLHPPDLSTVL